ncbi:hypothetical protein EV141_1597 [Microcella putealis]|uniref:Uncharacterized protein n=1 Tax=Microcella putealis TaxID=337005 RepID=A0A4Q7LMY8_9MICO|nr:septum formation family protein [Microcella putealis]RZS56145.1 hypothetical protein EV141_1597 [Microcella putealis]TQM23424.1 hypothetical protein BJ957_1787 [Microcella putealis]
MTENEGRWPFGGDDDAASTGDDEDARRTSPTDPASPAAPPTAPPASPAPPLAPWIPGQRAQDEPPTDPTFTELISRPAPPSAPPPSPLVEPVLPPPALQPPPALIPPAEPPSYPAGTLPFTSQSPTLPTEPPTDPSAAPSYPAVPPRIEDVATEAMPVMNEPLPTEAMPAAEVPGDAATELMRAPAPPGVGDAPIGGDVDGDVLAEVFAESNFREYEPEPLLLPAPSPAPAPAGAYPAGGIAPGAVSGAAMSGAGGVPGDAPRASGGGVPTPLLWTAGVLGAILLLIGLFLLGTRIPEWTAAEPEPTPTAEPEPTPEPEPEPEPDPLEGVPDGVPLPAGEWQWSLLRGGECIEPWVSPWEEQFTVVDCAEPHAAQLVLRAPIAEAPEEYPGPEAISAPLTLACSSPQVIDYGQAGAFDDIQIQTAYPVTPEEWAEGYREFFCFISRSSGEPLTGNLTLAPPSADAPTAGSTP